MSLGLLRSCCLLLLLVVAAGQQHYTGPCDNARVIKDDWRYPSEENKRKCDSRLRAGTWYKFKYQGQPAVVAQGPIKENHCSTSGPISVSLLSDTHLYPPLPGQSALYKACVHVTVMGVVSCVDHLTTPLLVMTCPDNDVIYFVNKTIKECPSAFCITGRDESVDRYYLIDAVEDERYYNMQPPDHSILETQQLTSSQMDGTVTYVTSQPGNESVARMDELKRHIAKALNLKSWSNCIGGSANRSSSCLDYEKSLIRSSITALGHIISEDSNDSWTEGISFFSDIHEEVRNASRLSYESSMLKFASSLCQVQPEDVKIIKLEPRTTHDETRTSLYVESFCGITRGSDLVRSLVWLNSTDILNSLVSADVTLIFKGIPVDQLPSTIIPEFWVNSGVWVSIFCCSFIMLSSIFLVYSFFSIKCVTNNHMNQKEKIFVVDCDGKTQWLNGPNKRRAHRSRSRCNTLTSTSKEAFQRQLSSVSGRRFSMTSKSTIISYLKTPPNRIKNWFKVQEKAVPPKEPDDSNKQEITESHAASSAAGMQVDDDMGWMVPLQEFKRSLPIPRLVVDTKRHNKGTRNILALN